MKIPAPFKDIPQEDVNKAIFLMYLDLQDILMRTLGEISRDRYKFQLRFSRPALQTIRELFQLPPGCYLNQKEFSSMPPSSPEGCRDGYQAPPQAGSEKEKDC